MKTSQLEWRKSSIAVYKHHAIVIPAERITLLCDSKRSNRMKVLLTEFRRFIFTTTLSRKETEVRI